MDYLQTEVSTSKQKKFPLVTFVDTPGLVDGDMNYPFDVNRALLWLGDLVDLIFVFFDPIGQVKTGLDQTSANNSTPPRYSKNIQNSAIIRGRIVGLIVAQYSTRPRVEYLYFRGIRRILFMSSRISANRGLDSRSSSRRLLVNFKGTQLDLEHYFKRLSSKHWNTNVA